MSFADSVRTCFSKYVTFSGRARRSEFWWFYLFTVICFIVVSHHRCRDRQQHPGVRVAPRADPAVAGSLDAPAARHRTLRLVGSDRPVPFVGAIILIVFECGDSQPGTNQYGPSPKELAARPAYNPPGVYPAPQGY